MAKIGTCSLCLESCKLTFEHVPPRRVFNSRPAVAHTIQGLYVGSEAKKPPPLLRKHGGLGRYALCESCNRRTATLYGSAFAEWTQQCLQYALKLRDTSAVLLPFSIQPLNVLKQIATMAISASGNALSCPKVDALRHFLLSPEAMHLPPEIAFKAYFNPSHPARGSNEFLTQNRLSESCAAIDTRSGTSVFVLAEIAFPPMGYVVLFEKRYERLSDDFDALCDLRRFTHYRLGCSATLLMHMPVRYPFGPVPGYYPNLNDPRQRQPLDDHHVVVTSRDTTTPA